MSNTLTGLTNDAWRAANLVSEELIGAIPVCTLNTDAAQRVALGDFVSSSFAPPATVGTITPSMALPNGTDQAIAKKSMTITDTASVKIPWNGEEIKHVNNGPGYETIYGQQIEEALRAIFNQIEAALCLAIHQASSRGIGTAGTTPFASDIKMMSAIRKILVNNGCPMNGNVTLVLDTDAGEALRNIPNLIRANEAGTDATLRTGELLNMQGLRVRESAQIAFHTKGTGSGHLVNNAGPYALTTEGIIVDTGTGTIITGDAVTFAGDTNNYMVNSALAANTLSIGAPGLRKTLADNVALTVGGDYRANVAFHKAAVELCVRPYAMPTGGDAGVGQIMLQDKRTGIPIEVVAYNGYRMKVIDVSCAYGLKVWLPKFVATLFG